jgi:hypothetical protein
LCRGGERTKKLRLATGDILAKIGEGVGVFQLVTMLVVRVSF